MQLCTFTAKTQTALMAQIREELGPDAVILETREKDGFITMTCALERNPLPSSGPRATGANAGSGKASFTGKAGSAPLADQAGQDPIPAGWRQWHQEWDAIKQHIFALMKPALKMEELTPRQRVALEYLQREGIDDEATLAVIQKLRDRPEATILDPLGAIVKVRPFGAKKWRERLHMLAGPFGAGKSTVAIRLALALRQEDPDLSICLINADATRGNGRLLLRHYSELSELHYKEAANTLELMEAVSKAESEGFDRIFIDLPGLSRGKYLEKLLNDSGLAAKDCAVHLTLTPHYGDAQLKGLLARYKTDLPGSLIWTKLDEAEQFGAIVNVAQLTGLPVSALSYGPGIGNSLSPAHATMLWRLLFKNELPESHGTR